MRSETWVQIHLCHLLAEWFFKKSLFICWFLAILGLRCCAGFSLVAMSVGCSLMLVCGLVSEHRLWSAWVSVVVVRGLSSCGAWALQRRLRSCGAWALQRRLKSCSTQALLLHGIWGLSERGSNPCLLNWQADSIPLGHQGSPQLSDLEKVI